MRCCAQQQARPGPAGPRGGGALPAPAAAQVRHPRWQTTAVANPWPPRFVEPAKHSGAHSEAPSMRAYASLPPAACQSSTRCPWAPCWPHHADPSICRPHVYGITNETMVSSQRAPAHAPKSGDLSLRGPWHRCMHTVQTTDDVWSATESQPERKSKAQARELHAPLRPCRQTPSCGRRWRPIRWRRAPGRPHPFARFDARCRAA